MNRELAGEIVTILIAQSRELNDALLKIQQECEEEEFVFYRLSFGKVMGYMLTDILNPIFKEHPDLIPEQLRER
jgi:hypothetical protein